MRRILLSVIVCAGLWTLGAAEEEKGEKPSKEELTVSGVLTDELATYFPKGKLAKLVDGRCSICRKEGRKSRVYVGSVGSCTALYCGSAYYDEEGKFVLPPACNTCTVEHICSNRHIMFEVTKQ